MKTKLLEYSSYLAIGLSVLGTIGVNQKEVWGQIVYILAGIAWLNYSIRRKLVTVAILNTIYLILAIIGTISWLK